MSVSTWGKLTLPPATELSAEVSRKRCRFKVQGLGFRGLGSEVYGFRV